MAGPPAADAFEAGAWIDAYRSLAGVAPDDLAAVDLDRLAVAAYLLGHDDEAVTAWDRGYQRHSATGHRAEAARCAFWAALCLMLRGQMAHAGGWLGRAESVLEGEGECPARGYLLIPALLRALDEDDAAEARRCARQARDIAARFGDADLMALAVLGDGQALLAAGNEPAGLARLDEAMLNVTSGEVGPIVSGIVYCAVILECMQIYDLARAAEWTAALDAWCRAQPGLVPYRGVCLVHQAQLRQAAGDWPGAVATVVDAQGRLSDPPHPALGLAHYQEGELHRLRGEVDAAADAYERASRAGYEPMPGWALLALQGGDGGSAAAGIERALAEATQPFQRPGLLAAAVEIHAARGDATAAADAAAELTAIAMRSASPVLRAMADQARGAALLASGRAGDALAALRTARATWQQLSLPYEAARNAELVGRACAALGDDAAATRELDRARATFASLDARPDLDRVLARDEARAGDSALTEREIEVLRLVAQGLTNPEIAGSLMISRHTVRRHLENIFSKLGVTSRAAAVAYAFEHDLL